MTNQNAGALMHKGVQCIKEDQTLVDAAKLMEDLGVGALPICGTDDRLKGMLTDRDIVVKCLAKGKNPETCTASELAEGNVIWVKDDCPAQEVLDLMEKHQVRRMPVLDGDKRLVGIISQGDVARTLGSQVTGELVGAVSQGPADR